LCDRVVEMHVLASLPSLRQNLQSLNGLA
jgi:hypothetical protein